MNDGKVSHRLSILDVILAIFIDE